jgi:hypothetical protein
VGTFLFSFERWFLARIGYASKNRKMENCAQKNMDEGEKNCGD